MSVVLYLLEHRLTDAYLKRKTKVDPDSRHQCLYSVSRDERAGAFTIVQGTKSSREASLYMAAVVAKRINPDIRALYNRLCAQGKTKMLVLGVCMRKPVHLCYGIMKSGRDYEFLTPKSA